MTDEIMRSNANPIAYGWEIQRMGKAATKEQLQRALMVVLRKQERDASRLKVVEPLASAVEAMIEKALEDKMA